VAFGGTLASLEDDISLLLHLDVALGGLWHHPLSLTSPFGARVWWIFVVLEMIWHGLGWEDTFLHTLAYWSMPHGSSRPNVSLLDVWRRTFEHYITLLGHDVTLSGFYLLHISFLALCRGKLRGRPHLFYEIEKLCGKIVLGCPHINRPPSHFILKITFFLNFVRENFWNFHPIGLSSSSKLMS
jgi:hypothetical protein